MQFKLREVKFQIFFNCGEQQIIFCEKHLQSNMDPHVGITIINILRSIALNYWRYILLEPEIWNCELGFVWLHAFISSGKSSIVRYHCTVTVPEYGTYGLGNYDRSVPWWWKRGLIHSLEASPTSARNLARLCYKWFAPRLKRSQLRLAPPH